MTNAGAIATTDLIKGETANEKLSRILKTFSKYIGHPVSVDEVVYRSEKETGHRNRAIGHMLRNFDVISSAPESVLDLYFQQCSISVGCQDLAMMAVTLANGGVNPISGETAVSMNRSKTSSV